MTSSSLSVEQPGGEMPSRRPQRNTSPLVWMCSTGALLGLLLLRSQQLHEVVAGKVAQTDAARAISDPGVTELAVNVGFYVGVVLSTLLSTLYFSLTSIAESTFFPVLKRGGLRFRVGLLGCTAIVSLLGVQLVSLLLSLTSPKDHWATFVYVALVGASSPFIFRKQWSNSSPKTTTAIVATSLATAAVSLAL